jgi:hypothetical protein
MRFGVRSVLSAVCCAVLGAGAASASTVTVMMAGTWDSVVDTASVLDGSISVGGSFTAMFTYDDSVPDVNSLDETGDYLLNGALGTLSFTTGNYSFVDQGTSVNGTVIDDNNAGTDAIYLFFDRFLASGPLPAGTALMPLAYANPSLIDYTETALSSDQLTTVVWDVSQYDTDFYFFGPVTGHGAMDYVEFSGAITGINVVPEPATSLLAAVALGGIMLRKRLR